MKEELKRFYVNAPMRDALKEFLDIYINDVSLQKLFSKENVSGLADAKEFIDGAFKELDTMFAPKAKKTQVNEER